MKLLVLHGPSLSLLGRREPDVYGTRTLADVDASIRAEAAAAGLEVRIVQSNHEGALVDELVACATDGTAGVILNAAAYAHSSLAIADAIRAIAPVPVVEVHLSNTAARDEARHRALVGAACVARLEGFGADGYAMAVRALARRLAGA